MNSFASLFNCMYNLMSSIEFDVRKSLKNLRERGMGFERFAEMDLDAALMVDGTRRDYGERRIRVLGRINGSLYAAVITPRGEKIRVISLRRASEREERAYEEERQSS